MFTGSPDYRAHLGIAKGLDETGRPGVPHFLFHALIAALFANHLAPSLTFAGRLVVVVCYILTSLTMFLLLWAVFRNSRIGRPWILFLAGLATRLAHRFVRRLPYSFAELLGGCIFPPLPYWDGNFTRPSPVPRPTGCTTTP